MQRPGCANYNQFFLRNGLLNLLIIDTSTRSTVLGLARGDELIDRSSVPGASHSREILPSIEALLAETGTSLKQLDGIIFGQGPGSFTGLRISVGVVQGLGYGLDLPLVPVSSMAALAQACRGRGSETDIFVALTARLEEIYYGGYTVAGEIVEPAISEGVADVADLEPLPAGAWAGVGNAWALQDKIESATGVHFTAIQEETIPSVQALFTLGCAGLAAGQTVDALNAGPVYLREEVAQKSR